MKKKITDKIIEVFFDHGSKLMCKLFSEHASVPGFIAQNLTNCGA